MMKRHEETTSQLTATLTSMSERPCIRVSANGFAMAGILVYYHSVSVLMVRWIRGTCVSASVLGRANARTRKTKGASTQKNRMGGRNLCYTLSLYLIT